MWRIWESRSRSAVFWQNCWRTRKSSLTRTTTTFLTPMTTAPLMTRWTFFPMCFSSAVIDISAAHLYAHKILWNTDAIYSKPRKVNDKNAPFNQPLISTRWYCKSLHASHNTRTLIMNELCLSSLHMTAATEVNCWIQMLTGCLFGK